MQASRVADEYLEKRMTNWRPGGIEADEPVWFCVVDERDQLWLGRLVAHRGGTAVAYFFPGPLEKPPEPAELAQLTPLDAATFLSFTVEGVGAPDLLVLPDIDIDEPCWPLVEFETRADRIIKTAGRRRRIRLVDDGRYFQRSRGDHVPDDEYDIRADESSKKRNSLPSALIVASNRFDPDRPFFDIVTELGAVYELTRVEPDPEEPARLVTVDFTCTDVEPGSRGDRLEELTDGLDLPDGDECDGWLLGDDATASVYLYTNDPDRLLAHLARETTIPRPAVAVVDPDTAQQRTIVL